MFTPPAVNQIAKAYRGNPEPLNAKVEADKKKNGGIPQDLRQLMAAYDIAQGRNAAGIQQALQTPTDMPTVAQSTQQQAQQAIQARMMQQMQQGQPNVVPQGTPEPRMQAKGIDALQTNVGEGYAGGGIIGFNGTSSSQFVQDIASLPQSFDEMKQRIREEDEVKAAQERRMAQRKQEQLEARSKTSLFNYLFGSPEREKEGVAKLAEMSSTPLSAAEKPAAIKATPLANIRSQLNAADVGVRTEPGTPPPAPTKTRVNTPAAPVEPAAPAAPAVVAPAPQSDAYKKLAAMMNQDPETKAQALRDRYNREVGPRDLSIYDRTAAELEARKEKLNAPKAGYDALMDYLENIAESGGTTWQDAGSGGARLRKKKQLAREAEQNTLMDKILELGGKKSEAQFGERKAMFDMTEKERDDIYKQAFDAAKSVNASDDEAKKIAAQAVEKELDRKAQAAENEKNRKNQLQAAAAGNRDNLMSRAQALMAADPSKKMTLDQAMQRAGEIGNAGAMESADVRRLAAYNASKAKLAEQYPEWSMPDTPKGREVRARYMRELAQARIDAGLTASGINALLDCFRYKCVTICRWPDIF